MTLKIPYKSLLLYLSLVSLYRLALDWIYRSVIAVSFAYAGFIWKPSLLLCAVSWALLTLFSCLMWPCYRNPENRISYEILFILFLISLVPFTVMVYAGMCPTAFWASNALYWFLLIRLCVRKRLFRAIKITGVMKRIQKAHVLIAVVLLLSVFYICARYSHFRLNFDLSKIYDLRSEAREYDYPTLLKYIFSWSRMVNAILIAYFIRRRYVAWTCACCAIQLLSFGIDGSKTTFFLLLFAVGINLLPQFSYSRFNKIMLCGFLALDVFILLWYYWSANALPISMFARRLSFTPISISEHFFDFFTTHQPDFFRQSFLRHFGFKSPYPSIAYMIAWEYTQMVSSANNGLISDAVANLGWAGIVVFPFLLNAALKLLDRCAKGLDERIVLSVALYASISLSNSFLFTVLLSHGLLVVMYLLFCLERKSSAPLRMPFHV